MGSLENLIINLYKLEILYWVYPTALALQATGYGD